jgi:hypothetical protein
MKSAPIQSWRELFGDAVSIVSAVMVSAISPGVFSAMPQKTVGKLYILSSFASPKGGNPFKSMTRHETCQKAKVAIREQPWAGPAWFAVTVSRDRMDRRGSRGSHDQLR